MCAGSWILSFFHALNATGYFALFAVQAAALAIWIRGEGVDREGIRRTLAKMRRRFRKPLPLAFVAICALNFLGGALNEISNGDSIAYRITRVHHWFNENGWHWIHTEDERMNVVGMNYEWLTAPIIMFCKDDRWIFLVSLVSFILLPTVFFVFLRQVRVRPKVAWWWMWLLPAGWIYAMQASSVATDGFSAMPAIAAVLFALRALSTRNVGDLWISILAFGFLTGIKQLTLPLAIVWIGPAILSARLLFKKPLIGAACIFVAALASALPVTVANVHYTGSWKGFKINYEQNSPVWGIIGNAVILPAQNFQPPLFPPAERWNEAMRRFVETPAGARFKKFELFVQMWRAPSEINSGLGFGLSILLAGSLLMMFVNGRAQWRLHGVPPPIKWVRWTPLIALGAFMAKSALAQFARYCAPFYPFLLPLVLAREGNSTLIRQRWWRVVAYGSVALTIALLATSRQRPAWPAVAVTNRLKEKFPNSGLVTKIQNSFTFSKQGSKWLAQVRALIPDSEKRVGYAANVGFKERTLWQAVPDRKVFRINVEDTTDYVANLGVDYVLVEPSAVLETPGKSIASWLEKYPGRILGTIESRTEPDNPPDLAYVIRLKR